MEVIGAEGMSPLADTVGFVDGNGAHGHVAAGCFEGWILEPFRRHKQKATRAMSKPGQLLIQPVGAQGTRDGLSRETGFLQSRHLIGHQRHQGADHQTHPATVQTRHLVADGLAASRGKDGEHILSRSCGLDHWHLVLPKLRVTPVLLQQDLERIEWG